MRKKKNKLHGLCVSKRQRHRGNTHACASVTDACQRCRGFTQQQRFHPDTPACPGRGRAAAGAAHCSPAPGPGRPASHGCCSCHTQQVQTPNPRLLLGAETPSVMPSDIQATYKRSMRHRLCCTAQDHSQTPTVPRPLPAPPPRLLLVTGRLMTVSLSNLHTLWITSQSAAGVSAWHLTWQ